MKVMIWYGTVPYSNDRLRMKDFIFIFYVLTGYKRSDYWSMKPIEMLSGAPNKFHDFMTLTGFEVIMSSLTFSTRKAAYIMIDSGRCKR